MRTNIDLNDKLIQEAFKFTTVKTKKELINTALEEFIENHSRKRLSDLRGKIQFDPDYDYKKMRERNK